MVVEEDELLALEASEKEKNGVEVLETRCFCVEMVESDGSSCNSGDEREEEVDTRACEVDELLMRLLLLHVCVSPHQS